MFELASGSPASPARELEATLGRRDRLHRSASRFLERNSADIELHSGELHRALARAVDHFSRAARHGSLPAPLRQRLMRASSQVAAQRESFARATAALDRADRRAAAARAAAVTAARRRRAVRLARRLDPSLTGLLRACCRPRCMNEGQGCDVMSTLLWHRRSRPAACARCCRTAPRDASRPR